MCLGRRFGERLLIQVEGVPIWITVVEVRDGRCRLGFEAPLSVVVRREEILPESEQYAATVGRHRQEPPALRPGGAP